MIMTFEIQKTSVWQTNKPSTLSRCRRSRRRWLWTRGFGSQKSARERSASPQRESREVLHQRQVKYWIGLSNCPAQRRGERLGWDGNRCRKKELSIKNPHSGWKQHTTRAIRDLSEIWGPASLAKLHLCELQHHHRKIQPSVPSRYTSQTLGSNTCLFSRAAFLEYSVWICEQGVT